MIRVNNKKVIGLLSVRSLQSARGRNFVAIVAIALTALLFTAVLTIGMSTMDLMEQNTMRQVGTSTHAGYKLLTQEQYDKVAADGAVKDIAYTILVGLGENPELNKTHTEIRYAQDKAAQWNFCAPTTGRMPQAIDEAACSTAVLDALGVPHVLGQTITLEFTSQGTHYRDTFTLCGFWEQDIAVKAATVLVSEAYCKQVAPLPEIPYNEAGTDSSYMSGYLNPNLWFRSAWDIEGQVEALNERCGFGDEVNSGVNWAYGSSTVDLQTVVLVGGVLLLILLAGYLIIYNIFAISVARDIRFYGLLKTIGTTGRQLKRIVHRQALLLAAFGIPIGLVIGWFVAKALTPVLLGGTSYGRFTEEMATSLNPWIFVGGALLALITIWISCIRPCRVASKVSPIEAVRWTGTKTETRKKQKKSGKVSPFTMAWANLKRTPAKTAVVLLSLTLSMVLLNGVYTITTGFDMDKYLANQVVSDFLLTDASVLNVSSQSTIVDGISEADMAAVQAQPGVEAAGRVYMQGLYQHTFTGVGLERLQAALAQAQESGQLRPPYTDSAVAMIEEEHATYMSLYGVEEFPFSKIEAERGSLNWEEFQTGRYILVGPSFISDDREASADSAYYQPGETVPITWPDGTTVEYEVMAVASLPYALGPQYSTYFGADLILPASEFLKHADRTGALNVAFDVSPEQEETVQAWVEQYCAQDNPNLSYQSKDSYEKSFQGMVNMFAGVGGALAGVLGLIGVLNFINAIATSIYTRRRELAMLQSVGMTGKQLNGMLMGEGLLYVGITLLLTATLGSLLCWGLIQLVAGQMWYFTYHFTLTPVLICIPLMLLMAALVPWIAYRTMCRESVVERLREAE